MTTNDTASGTSEEEQARNRSFGAGLVQDPYPVFEAMRNQCPVHEGSIVSHFPELADAQTLVPDSAATFATCSFDATTEVLRQSDIFSSEEYYSGLTASIGHSIIAMDEPDHRRMRLLLQPAFSRPEMERWRETIIAPIVDGHFDRIAPLGRAQLNSEIGATVPVHTIAAALGLPIADRDRFYELAVAMTSPALSLDERREASTAVAAYVTPLVTERRKRRSDDLIGILVNAHVPSEDADHGVDDRPLSDEEIATFVRVLVVAGAGTTYRAYGCLMYHLLSNPQQLAEAQGDPALRPAAIEEALRIDQPLAALGRVTVADTEVAGVEVPVGSRMDVSIGAANHDPAQWKDPDRFDIHRDRSDRHLSFGFGIHRCLGIHLARAELELMLERTLARLPGLRLDPEIADVHITGVGLRVVNQLPVLFEPS